MHLANLTTAGFKRILGLVLTVFIYSISSAQENSPYSRYGIGDLVPNQNITSRGMGGIAIGYNDNRSINFYNPASLASISNTIFDIGGEVDIRTLKSTTSSEKYKATNTLISYLQVGFPLLSRKLKKTDPGKNVFWGMSFGLRPVSRIGYKIEKDERKQLPPLSDSLITLYEGSGGLNQINIGTGLRVKNFSIGINTGYSFGNKDYSTKLQFINDSVVYYKSNTEASARYSGVFLDVGLQYAIRLTKIENGKKVDKGTINIGAFAKLQQNLRASKDNIDETFAYDGNGGIINIDTVSYHKDLNGHIKIPATYGIGFTYSNTHWLWGADFETTNWSSYRFYGQQDAVQNNWTVRAGAQYCPADEHTSSRKYWYFVKYRAGVYFGPDYVKLNNSRTNYAATLGASLPLVTASQYLRYGDFVYLNIGAEVGARGNRNSFSVRENITRFSVGISMNARWFQKRNYD